MVSTADKAARETQAEIARQIRRAVHDRRSVLLERLAQFVRAESPSTDTRALDRFALLLAGQWREAGAKVRIVRQSAAGNHVAAHFGPQRRDRPFLILGHYDTVYPLGTLGRMPFRVRGRRAMGPGVLDMKSGLAIALAAMEALRALRLRPVSPVVCLFTSDEEIGSRHSRSLIGRYARAARAAFVLEPAAGVAGKLKTARKGTGEIELIARGKAAHAGLDPEAGINAIDELALQLERIRRFNDPAAGTAVQVGVIEGGTRTNVIPERARAVIDLRVSRRQDAAPLERRFRALRPILPGARVEVRGGFSRPPMERGRGIVRLFERARRLGQLLGLRLEEASVGGASDGNFTAALGVPTLDGLGGVGDGAHSAGEFVFVESLVERAALLALLLTSPEND